MPQPICPAMIGRFGNQCFSYCYSRALAEQTGREFHTHPWPGELVFDIPIPPRPQIGDEIIGGYHQDQASLIYTRKQVREWFKWRPEISKAIDLPKHFVAAHRRC